MDKMGMGTHLMELAVVMMKRLTIHFVRPCISFNIMPVCKVL